MARPKRKKIEFTEDSVNDLLQEIYNDSHNTKAKITRLFLKWEKFATEGGEIAAIGDQIIKLISQEAKNQDQKIMLLKYLKEVVFDRNKDKKPDEEQTGELSAEKRSELLKMVNDHVVKKTV